MVSLLSSLLDMEKTGPELCCSSKTPAHGKWLSSEPWKFLILVGAIHVQLCFAFVEKKNYTEIWDKRALSQPVLKKDAWNYGRRAWNFCYVYIYRSQLNRPLGFRGGTDPSLCSKEQAVLLGSNRAEALGRRLLPTVRICLLCKPHSIILQIEWNSTESLSCGEQLGYRRADHSYQ